MGRLFCCQLPVTASSGYRIFVSKSTKIAVTVMPVTAYFLAHFQE